ncbi:GDP-mannose dehydrogenase, partial [Pseudomonas syringae pv. tagetis]
KFPDVSSLLISVFDIVINDSEVIILGIRDERFRALANKTPEGKGVIERVGFMTNATSEEGRAEGVCW